MAKSKTIEVKLTCEVPIVPNYLKTPAGHLPLCAVTEDALRILGGLWTEALIERSRKQRQEQHGTEGP
jgi:hypothetical protein